MSQDTMRLLSNRVFVKYEIPFKIRMLICLLVTCLRLYEMYECEYGLVMLYIPYKRHEVTV